MDFALIKRKFEEDGYVFLPGFFSDREVAEVNRRLEDFIQNTVPGLRTMSFMKIETTLPR